MNDVHVLPDGSAFSTASMPLPKDHWLYAPRTEEEYCPPKITISNEYREVVREAVKHAIRGATMCGKEPDFDPDALVQNAVARLCGPRSVLEVVDNGKDIKGKD